MKRLIFISMIVMSGMLFGQGGFGLDVHPKQIKFSDVFNRMRKVTITNNTSGAVRIDSIKFPNSILDIRKNNFRHFPVTLEPSQMLSFDVILLDFEGLRSGDSSAVIEIFNNSADPVIQLPVSIGFDMPRKMRGEIKGTVADSSGPVSGADVYFFYNGIHLIDSVKTGADGSFQKQLPSGEYFIAAVKDGYYTQFADGKDSPLDADFVSVDMMTPPKLNFILEKEVVSPYVITGRVKDKNSEGDVKSVVVIRKGIHTPTKVSARYADDFDRSYTVITDDMGNYEIDNIPAGEYYVQAFAGYYLPGYFNEANEAEVFWQKADSVNVDGTLHNCDIFLARDSLFGGGAARGKMHWKDNRTDRLDDALVFILSEKNDVYGFSFARSTGDFKLSDLPRGRFKLRAQKFGVPDSDTGIFEISDNTDTVENLDITFVVTDVQEMIFPEGYRLYQNYPNPFNPSTNISYYIPESGYISLKIYDILGNLVTTLQDGIQISGLHSYVWKGDDALGQKVASGTYIYELRFLKGRLASKLLYLR